MKRIILKLIFVITSIHFLKDITQDILHVSTILDYLGNVQEDLTNLSPFFAGIIVISGYLSFIGEIIIITLVPVILKNNFQQKTHNTILLITCIALALYFLSVSILDPKIIGIFQKPK